MTKEQQLDAVRDRVLKWLETIQIGPVNYQMHEGGSANVFTSCFALFILDLLGETNKLQYSRQQEWIAYIQSRQNERYGYFEPESYCHKDTERNRLQLTCFCLSALGILGARPQFALKYLDDFKTPQDIQSYLRKEKVHLGSRGSGNKAMFLAIALSYEYERTREKRFWELLQSWFDFHDHYQNSSGFWGATRENFYYHGFQNGLHQFVVYFYWGHPVSHKAIIVDNILSLQGQDSHFNVVPCGESCMDYDAVHILINAYLKSNYRRNDIAAALQHLFPALLANQNSDGGFCHSRCRPDSIRSFIQQIPYYIRWENPYLWYHRLRKAAGIMKHPDCIMTGWVPEGRKWHQSNLWDTWFRLLTIAEITEALPLSDCSGIPNWRFHKVIGLGHFKTK